MDDTAELIQQHKQALEEYQYWDAEIKRLLKGRKMRDLDVEDIDNYRQAAEKRDVAYNRMRRFERALLDDIPGASTGQFKPPADVS
ncbi:MAG: hypothetical protein GYB64_03425 [Chloroflexi bacterium]|nr:hypothetical protein [Chloroflexota bacterium]